MPVSTDTLIQERLAAMHQTFAAAAGSEALNQPYSAGVALPSGDVIAQVASAPLFADVLGTSDRHAGERYPASAWRNDHVFISNTPFLGGLALDTVVVLAPVIAGATAALVGLAVRYRDVGAMARTAFTLRRETRHEGFCLSLLRIAVPGNLLPETLVAMLGANVRNPDEAAAWLRAQVAAARGVAADLAAEEGANLVIAAQRPTVAIGAPLGRIPTGRFEGIAGLMSPGDVSNNTQVQVEVTVSEADVHVKLAVSDADKVDAECNASLSATRAAVLTALSDVAGVPPWMLARSTRIDTAGSDILNAAYPAAVAKGEVTAFGCYEAVLNALRHAGTGAVPPRSLDAFAGRA